MLSLDSAQAFRAQLLAKYEERVKTIRKAQRELAPVLQEVSRLRSDLAVLQSAIDRLSGVQAPPASPAPAPRAKTVPGQAIDFASRDTEQTAAIRKSIQLDHLQPALYSWVPVGPTQVLQLASRRDKRVPVRPGIASHAVSEEAIRRTLAAEAAAWAPKELSTRSAYGMLFSANPWLNDVKTWPHGMRDALFFYLYERGSRPPETAPLPSVGPAAEVPWRIRFARVRSLVPASGIVSEETLAAALAADKGVPLEEVRARLPALLAGWALEGKLRAAGVSAQGAPCWRLVA